MTRSTTETRRTTDIDPDRREMKQKLLYETLSYEVRGCAIEVRKNYGPGHKESLYQNAYAEELASQNISFKKEEPIKIYSPKTGKVIGSYRPDFIMTTRFACLVY